MGERIYTGEIVSRNISNNPWVKYGKEPYFAPVALQDIDVAKGHEGKEVRFVLRQLAGFTNEYAVLIED